VDGATSPAATARRLVLLFLGIAMIAAAVFASTVHREGTLRLVETHGVVTAIR